ncbi:SCO7613 C-terminal domain-containing membrane protein [Kitasatospora sp. NBC_01539]|uniref:SCO7613 C-terminal domain-containing membrane protein n=1 Tax=Kitasatospora sp. NBC_01539 TaxID=2903577 RepID=UPI0038603097
MTTPYSAPCPDCGADLGPGRHSRCPHCRLPLTGADAGALWQVVMALHGLDEQRGAMLRHRDHLLAGLRARRDAPDTAPVWAAPPGAPPVVPPPRAMPSAAGADGSGEVSGRSAQTVLLVLGGLLVSLAALVFTVVSWGRLGIGGRGAVLFGLTAVALAVASPLRRRRLTATAEAAAAVGLGFLVLDCYAVRAAGLAGLDGVDGLGYWAGATALLAAGSLAYGRAQRLRIPRAAGHVLTRVPVLLALAAAGVEQVEAYAAAMVAATVLDTTLLVRADGRTAGRAAERTDGRTAGWTADAVAPERHAEATFRRVGAGFAAVWALLGGGVAVLGSVLSDGLAEAVLAWGPLGVLAALGMGSALRSSGLPHGARQAVAAGAAVAALAAAGGTLRPLLPWEWTAVAYGLPAVLLVVGAGMLLRHRPQTGAAAARGADSVVRTAWTGVLCAAAAVLGAASLGTVPRALAAALVPLGHAPAAWGGADGSGWDRQTPWQVPGSALVGLALVAVALGAVAALGAVRLPARVPATGAVVTGLPVVALAAPAAGLPYGVSVGWALLLAAAAAAAVAVRPGRPAWAGLAVAGGLASLWASADRTATIVALGACAALAAATAWRAVTRGGSTGRAAATAAAGAVLALGVEAAAIGDTAGLAQPSVALAILGVAAATAPVAAVIARRTRDGGGAAGGTAPGAASTAGAASVPGAAEEVAGATTGGAAVLRRVAGAVEGTGYALAVVALGLMVTHPGVLAFGLAAAGVVAAAVALRADRRAAAGIAATVLLLASTWVRLALWGVVTPEAYTAGLAGAALTVGHLRYRRDAAASSWAAYGPGLGLGLAPSVLALGADGHWLRPLLLGGAALGVTLLGVRFRLQAPLVLGGGTLLVTAAHELAPTVVQVLGLLPRWAPPAAAGLLLLALGAGYEQRLRDARRLRDGLRRLR